MWGPGVWRKPCRKCLRMSFTAGVINKADAPWEVCPGSKKGTVINCRHSQNGEERRKPPGLPTEALGT